MIKIPKGSLSDLSIGERFLGPLGRTSPLHLKDEDMDSCMFFFC
jgi:hypothetical protein